MAMDMAARAMAKQADDKAIKQGSTKLAAADKRIFSLPNAADGALSVEGVKGKTAQNIFNNENYYQTQLGTSTKDGDYFTITSINQGSTSANMLSIVNVPTIKPNTTYTLFFAEVPINNMALVIRDVENSYNLGDYRVSDLKVKFTTPNVITNKSLLIYYTGLNVGQKVKVRQNLLCLEGDWTNKEVPPYFEGIQSVGEDTGKLTVKSTAPNIIDPKLWEIGGVTWAGGSNFASTDRMRTKGFIEVVPGLTIRTNERVYFILYDKNFTYLGTGKIGDKTGALQTYSYKIENEVRFIRLIIGNSTDLSFASKVTGTYLNEITTNSNFGESKIEIPLTEPLRSLPNGVSDEIKDGKIIRRVGKVVLNGSESWSIFELGSTTQFYVIGMRNVKSVPNSEKHCISDVYPSIVLDERNTKQGIFLTSGGPAFTVAKGSITLEGFREKVRAQNITVFYELETPIETPITIPAINSFTNGMVTIENNIWPSELTLSYSTNVVARVINAESTLSGVLASTLTLADKELAMKSIPSLATAATLPDTVAKINQILNIWR